MTFKPAIGNRKSTMRRAARPLRHTSPQGCQDARAPCGHQADSRQRTAAVVNDPMIQSSNDSVR
jgi:hypothetical protein